MSASERSDNQFAVRRARYEALNLAQTESESDTFTVERYRQFHRHFPCRIVDVLDVGCNTGRGGRELADLDGSLRIVGLDAVQSRIDRLPMIYSNGLVGLSTDIPAADGTFDVVLAGELIEHIYSRDVGGSLAEFFRVLRVGGRLLLTTPNPNGVKLRFRHQSVLGGAHVSQHFPRVLRWQLRSMGFSRVRLYGSGKTSRYLHEWAPLPAYGSYLVSADKW